VAVAKVAAEEEALAAAPVALLAVVGSVGDPAKAAAHMAAALEKGRRQRCQRSLM